MLIFRRIYQCVYIAVAVAICLQFGFAGSTASAANSPAVRELNFVFLHGAGGNPCGPQLLSDSILEQIPDYIEKYQQAHPGIEIKVDMMNRCYPSDVAVETWAANITDSIDKHFAGRENLILIGHSMGGKSALYAVAHDVGGLADKVAMVVTIDSPIKKLNDYQLVGGGAFSDFCRARWLLQPDSGGVCDSVGSYDSSEDGNWVSQNKHWLAFVSGESAPLSPEFDYGGFDPYPRDMDDGALPMSAQYAEGADVIYYGEHGHSDFTLIKAVADPLAGQILDYIFGGTVQCSVPARSGDWQHKAGFLLGTDYWQDIVADVLGNSGSLSNWNPSLTRWQEWVDTVDYVPVTYENQLRSQFAVASKGSFPFLTKLIEARWLSDDPSDCRLYLKTSAAPQNTIKVSWNIYVQGLLPEGKKRDHYEIEITAGTPMAAIDEAAWQTGNPRDLRVGVSSHAERPFRWYQATWRVYYQEPRQRNVIDEIAAE